VRGRALKDGVDTFTGVASASSIGGKSKKVIGQSASRRTDLAF